MLSIQSDVEKFCEALDLPQGKYPQITNADFRARLIMEEAVETVEAMTGRNCEFAYVGGRMNAREDAQQDIVKMIDGLCDLIYVTIGAAVQMGIDLEPFWDEVQRTNMAKVGGEIREDGKRLKPEGWKPPEIRKILHQERLKLIGVVST